MIKINPKKEFGTGYVNLRIKPFLDAQGNISHKHIYAVKLDKYYVKDREHNWYKVNEGECELCTK